MEVERNTKTPETKPNTEKTTEVKIADTSDLAEKAIKQTSEANSSVIEPAALAKPAVSDKPAITDKPVISEKPVAAAKPEAAKPEAPETPVALDKPANSDQQSEKVVAKAAPAPKATTIADDQSKEQKPKDADSNSQPTEKASTAEKPENVTSNNAPAPKQRRQAGSRAANDPRLRRKQEAAKAQSTDSSKTADSESQSLDS